MKFWDCEQLKTMGLVLLFDNKKVAINYKITDEIVLILVGFAVRQEKNVS